MTKVGILGAGAIGSLVGGLIQTHDPEVKVVMLARGEHGRMMEQRGTIVLQGPWGTRETPVTVCTDLEQLRDCDLHILTVKSQDTVETLERVGPYLGDATIVSLQNGTNQAVLRKFLPAEQFLVGMTAINVALVEPGTVSLQLDGVTMIGSTLGDPPQDRIEKALQILRKSGLAFKSHENIVGVQLNKVSINCPGYASVLSQSSFLTECILDRSWRNEVAKPLLDECFAVLKAAGVNLVRVPGPSDIKRFRNLLNLLDVPLLGWIAATVIRITKRKRIVYSVEQDLIRRKPTEIDYVNGEIVRLAKEHGTEAPLNEKVVEMVHQLEQRDPLKFFSMDEVVEQFRQLRASLS
ncbi:2-dehydropantoate 2-reductase [Bremerella cremea]|uniref:ketopantoate reductase family protein n=1 Tax=Bremerella cremea TaxID=1031537 RepID=UPI0031E66390